MARNKGPRKTNHYTAEFKLKAVKLSSLEGVQVQHVAEALDIHPIMLSRWRKEAREGLLRGRVGIVPGARERGEMREFSKLKRTGRRRTALLKASMVNFSIRLGPRLQPRICRECRSITTARYRQPLPLFKYVTSPTHT